MAELMTANTTFDTVIDTGVPVTAPSFIVPATVNGMLSAILAIENILGIGCAGTQGTLSARLSRMVSVEGGLLYGTSDPTSPTPVAGQLFWRTDQGLLRVYNSVTAQFQDASAVALGGVGTAQLADFAVTTPKLALLAVTDAQIAASGITTRSKLPLAIAYEDEANTFSAANIFSGLNLFSEMQDFRKGVTFGSDTGPVIASDLTVIAKRINLGYDGTNDIGFISAIETGVFKNLLLQGGSGFVKIGGGLTFTQPNSNLDVRDSTNKQLLGVNSLVDGHSFLSSSGGNAHLVGNAWYDGANWQRFDTAKASSSILMEGSSALQSIRFNTAPAGVGVVPFVERFSITHTTSIFTQDLLSLTSANTAAVISEIINTSLLTSSYRVFRIIKHGSTSPSSVDHVNFRIMRSDNSNYQDWALGPGSTPLVSGGPMQLLFGEVPGARLTSLATIPASAGVIPTVNLPATTPPVSVGIAQLKLASGSFSVFSSTVTDFALHASITDFGANISSFGIFRNNFGVFDVASVGMNRLSFFPKISGGGTNVATATWEYMTASDEPTVWVFHNVVDGGLDCVWVSDDPMNGDVAPFSLGTGSHVTLNIPRADLVIFQPLIDPSKWSEGEAKASSPDRVPFRAIEAMWGTPNVGTKIHTLCKVDVVTGKIVLK